MARYERSHFIPIVTIPNVESGSFSIIDWMSADYVQERRLLVDYITSYDSYLVTEANQSLPEVISYDVYGTSDLWWVLCLYNGIIDPMRELLPGVELKVPNLEQIDSFLQISGNTSSPRIQFRLLK